jgi:CDP-diacylglycerol---glycerol-3-phosphate 3-phosphatidyltransferase
VNLKSRALRICHRLADHVIGAVAGTGIYPGVLTAGSVVAYLCACIFFAMGRFPAGGAVMIAGGACDLLDGPVAARQRRLTLFAHFLDSILDRYADLIVFVGLLIYFARVNRFLDAIVAGAAMAGAVLVSYSQARAESLIESCNVGFWRRPERVILLIGCALANHVMLALWILAIGANITVIHRILYTWKQTKRPSSSAQDSPLAEVPAFSRSAGSGG